jgi:hypothetical protein
MGAGITDIRSSQCVVDLFAKKRLSVVGPGYVYAAGQSPTAVIVP